MNEHRRPRIVAVWFVLFLLGVLANVAVCWAVWTFLSVSSTWRGGLAGLFRFWLARAGMACLKRAIEEARLPAARTIDDVLSPEERACVDRAWDEVFARFAVRRRGRAG
jgi:hypothetical protein